MCNMNWTNPSVALAALLSLLLASSGARPSFQVQDGVLPKENCEANSHWDASPVPEINVDGSLAELRPQLPHAVASYIKKQTSKTQKVLEPFTSLKLAPVTNTPSFETPRYLNLARRMGDYCYKIVDQEESKPLSVLVRMPVPEHTPDALGVCLDSSFPMTLKSLGKAEIVVNLTAHGDAAQIGSLFSYWVSPDGKKVAYTFQYLEKGIAVEVKDVDSREPAVRLTTQSCDSLAWRPDSKHLLYIQRGPDDWCSDVTMYHPAETTRKATDLGRLPDPVTSHFNGRKLRLILHSTKSYNFLEHRTKTFSALFIIKPGSGEIVFKEMYRTEAGVRFSLGEILGGVLVVERRSVYATRAQFVAASAVHDFLADDKMKLSSSALQAVALPADSVMQITSSDSCLVRWETHDIQNRFAVQRLEGHGGSQRLSAPRYVEIAGPTNRQALLRHTLPDGEHAVLTYATLFTPVNVYSLNCNTSSMVLEHREIFPSYNVAPYVEAGRFIPTSNGRQGQVTFYYKKDRVKLDSQSPMLLAVNTGVVLFSGPGLTARLFSLMDQGLIVALAYTRKPRVRFPGMESKLIQEQQDDVNDVKAIIRYAVSHNYTSQHRLMLLGTFEGSASIAALINSEPHLCKSAVLLQADVDSVATLSRASGNLDVDEASLSSMKAARAFSPIDHIPQRPPYFPDILVVGMHSTYTQQPSISARYHSLLTRATQGKSLTLLYVDSFAPGRVLSPYKVLRAFLFKTICPSWDAEHGCLPS